MDGYRLDLCAIQTEPVRNCFVAEILSDVAGENTAYVLNHGLCFHRYLLVYFIHY